MSMLPMFIISVAFLVVGSILFMLWQCRYALVARIGRAQQQELEFRRQIGLTDPEAALGPVLSPRTMGAPQRVIDKLPVFTYMADTGGQDDVSEVEQDQSSSGNAARPAVQPASETAGTLVQLQRPSVAAEGSSVDSISATCPAPASGNDASEAEAACSNECRIREPPATSAQQHATREAKLSKQQQQHSDDVSDCARSLDQSSVTGVKAPSEDLNHGGLQAEPCHESPQQPEAQIPEQQQLEQLEPQQDPKLHQQHPQLQQLQEQLEEPQHADSSSSTGEDSCVICFASYAAGDLLKQLPCKHTYHAQCVDTWLRRNGTCPLCKASIWTPSSFELNAMTATRRASIYSGWGGAAAAAGPAGTTAAGSGVRVRALSPQTRARVLELLTDLQQQLERLADQLERRQSRY